MCARAKFFMDSDVFRTGTLQRPLRVTNARRTQYDIVVDASECYLAEKFVLPFCGQLVRQSHCCGDGCSSRQIPYKFLPIVNNSISTTVDDALKGTTLREGGCQQRVAGAEEEVCGGTRRETAIHHLSKDAPTVVIFAASEPSLNSKVTQLDYPAFICMWNKQYKLSAVSFLARPRTLHGSGHYTCIFKTNQGWIHYNGLKNKSKPAFLMQVKGPKDRMFRELDPCLITYAIV